MESRNHAVNSSSFYKNDIDCAKYVTRLNKIVIRNMEKPCFP